MSVTDTDDVTAYENLIVGVFDSLRFAGSTNVSVTDQPFGIDPARPPRIDAVGEGPASPASPRAGRRYILVDEWGPHDFKSPIFWPRSSRRALQQTFEILGPPGAWKVVSTTGVDSMSAMAGTVPDSVAVWLSPGWVV